MKKIITFLFALATLPALAQTPQIPTQTFTASTTGTVTLDSQVTAVQYGGKVDTLSMVVAALGTSSTWSADLQVSATQLGTYVSCPGGTIAGAAVSVAANVTLNVNCKPQGAGWYRLVVTAGTGGGSITGSVNGTNSQIGFNSDEWLNLATGGTVTGATNFTGGLQVYGTPAQFNDYSGWGVQFWMQAEGYDQWAVTACGYGCGFAGGVQAWTVGTRGTSWPPPLQITQTTSEDAIVGVNGSLAISATTTVVNCSTSGTATFTEPNQGATDKRCSVLLASCSGTASYTFPVAFTTTPGIVATNQVAAGVFTSVSATAVTVTGAPTTGTAWLIGS